MLITRPSPRRVPVAWAVLLLAVIGSLAASAQSVDTSSEYLPTRDGTRLAVDIHLPGDRRPDARLPAAEEPVVEAEERPNPFAALAALKKG